MDVALDARIAECADQDGVELPPKPCETIRWDSRSIGEVSVSSPIKVLELYGRLARLNDLDRCRNHFLADPIAGNDCDLLFTVHGGKVSQWLVAWDSQLLRPEPVGYNQNGGMSFAAQHEIPASEGEDLRSELRALVSGCAAYRIDRTLVSLSGKDRTRWLNGMVSNNIRDLASAHGLYAFVLNPQGQIQGDLYVFNRGETLILAIDRSQPNLLPQLRRYIIMDKVEVQELGDSVAVFGIAGAGSERTLASLGITVPLANLELSETQWNGVATTVVRGDNPCVPDYEVWVPKEHADEFSNAALQAGARQIGSGALEAFRILCGIPKVGIDIRERTLPQETAQERALNFNKGCYIGQEIVERIRARGSVHRILTGYEVSGGNPLPSTSVQVGGKDIGLITSTATVPTRDGNRVIALGFMRKEHLSSGATFEAAGLTFRPAPLPFSSLIQQL